MQINDIYCGPAVLEMLMGFNGIKIDQEAIVKAAGNADKIKIRGTLPEEIGIAVKNISPAMQFWYKRFATLKELSTLVNYFHQPAGIEWQGVFEDEEGEDGGDDDPGHYSIVTKIDTHKNIVMIADPYKHYARKDRRFSILEFERRWWDINEVVDPVTKHKSEMYDYHLMFTVAPEFVTFPAELKMIRG